MGKSFFNLDDGDFGLDISDNMAMDFGIKETHCW